MMRTLGIRSRLAACLLVAAAIGMGDIGHIVAAPSEEEHGSKYLRLTRDKADQPLAMETPIVRFVPVKEGSSSLTVDLVAAVHIAEKNYYEQLNREFENYEAVLYELVAPEESAVPRRTDAAGNHPLTLLQNGMKDILGLQYQLQGIDYTRDNMIHADMSPDEFAESMQERGESAMGMMVRMFGYALTQQGNAKSAPGNTDLLLALFDKNRSLALKRIVAEQFESNEGAMAALDGPKGSTLISGRNRVALGVLREQIDAGKRKIAIFYGAAHMPDFEAKLRKEFGLKPAETRWIEAWSLRP